jgi:hypothetical protein
MRRSIVVLLIAQSMACSSEVEPRPPAQPPAAAARVAPSAKPNPPPPADPLPARDRSRVFREALVLRSNVEPQQCGAFLSDVSVTPNGAAWVVGDCNVRLSIRRQAELWVVANHPTRWLKVERSLAGQSYSCPARMMFTDVLAVSEREVYARGARTCGTDPNSYWPQRFEHFDGSGFRPVAWPESPDQLELTPDGSSLWGFSCCAHQMVSGRAVPKPARVFRWEQRRWIASVLPPPADLDEVRGVAFARDGTAWLLGTRDKGPNRALIASGRDGKWTEHDVADEFAHDVSIAPDGTVWLATDRGLFRREADRWTPVKTGLTVWSVLPRSASEAWLIASPPGQAQRWAVVHLRGDRAVSIAVTGKDAAGEDLMALAAAGDHIWLLGRQTLARLERIDEPAIAPHVHTIAPPPEKLEAWRPR